MLNLQIAEAASPRNQPGGRVNSPGDFRRLGARGAPRGAQSAATAPGSCAVVHARRGRATKFYGGMLGMRLSDTVGGDMLAFLRTAGDSDHHVLAFARSDRTGFHHASFEVGGLDEIVLGAAAHGGCRLPQRLGLGRHVIGPISSTTCAIPGTAWPSTSGISTTCRNETWDAKDWGPEDGFFLWSTGGPPPADFVRNFEEGFGGEEKDLHGGHGVDPEVREKGEAGMTTLENFSSP